MLKDGHMPTRALSHWVNGATFHTQMLVHQARLEDGDGSRATFAVDKYRTHVTDFSRPLQINGQDSSNLNFKMELEGPKNY